MVSGLLSGAALAGPWVHPVGTGFTKVELTVFAAGEEVRYRSRSLSVYTEVGVAERVEVVAELPYAWSSNAFGDSALRYRSSGPGTARLGVGVGAPVRGLPLAVHLIGRIPLAAETGGTPIDPPLGDAQVDLDLLGSIGGSAPAGPHLRTWGLAEIGVRHRTSVRPVPGIGRPGQDVLYRVQLGVLPDELGWVQLEAGGVEDVRGGLSAHRAGGGVAVALVGGLHLQAGLARVYAARGGAPGWGWTLGIAHVAR